LYLPIAARGFLEAERETQNRRTISARLAAVNWKMGKLTKDQVLGGEQGRYLSRARMAAREEDRLPDKLTRTRL
jgi:hypothetical protein